MKNISGRKNTRYHLIYTSKVSLKGFNVATVASYTENSFTHTARELPSVNLCTRSHRPRAL